MDDIDLDIYTTMVTLVPRYILYNLLDKFSFDVYLELGANSRQLLKLSENEKKAYQSAWNNLVERQEERQILQIKLESVGVLVDDPEIERPIIDTQVEAAE